MTSAKWISFETNFVRQMKKKYQILLIMLFFSPTYDHNYCERRLWLVISLRGQYQLTFRLLCVDVPLQKRGKKHRGGNKKLTEYFRILKQVVVKIVNYLKRLYALSAAFHCFQIINLARKQCTFWPRSLCFRCRVCIKYH